MDAHVSQADFRSGACTILPSFGAENTQLTVTFPKCRHQDMTGIRVALGQFELNTTVLSETDEILSLTGSVPTIVPLDPSMMARVPIQFPVYLVLQRQSFLVGHFGYLMPTRTWNGLPVQAVPPWAAVASFVRGDESHQLQHQHTPAPLETVRANMDVMGHMDVGSSSGEVHFDHYFRDTPTMPEDEHFTSSSTDHAYVAFYEERPACDNVHTLISQSSSEPSHLSFNSSNFSVLSSPLSSTVSTDPEMTYRKRGRPAKRKKISKPTKAASPPRQALREYGKVEVEFHPAEERDQGGLDALVHNWTEQETHIGRRVIAFWRLPEQLTDKRTLRFQYKSLPQTTPAGACTRQQPHQHHNQHAAVSCVYWPERDEHYITSVDIVTLIEFLMQSRFTVEEKNRVRRNLEGFHPTTISKCKRATESFFKRIMRFDAPRPRNIEKDIKVYPWLSLSKAIVKVVGKLHAAAARPTARRILQAPNAPKEVHHPSSTQESSGSRSSSQGIPEEEEQ